IPDVPGATGYFDTDYRSKARVAIQQLKKHDFVWVHVESPDEAGHLGSIEKKIEAIENIDKKVIGPMIDDLKGLDDYRMLIVPDHATPVSTRGHKGCPVPYLLYDSKGNQSRVRAPYDERAAYEKVPMIDEGFRLIDELLK
ncbi:MAG: phosphoglycerate mutase, partial [Chthonomonadales bacterium]